MELTHLWESSEQNKTICGNWPCCGNLPSCGNQPVVRFTFIFCKSVYFHDSKILNFVPDRQFWISKFHKCFVCIVKQKPEVFDSKAIYFHV